MPSKGVDYYAYLSASRFHVTFTKPTEWNLLLNHHDERCNIADASHQDEHRP